MSYYTTFRPCQTIMYGIGISEDIKFEPFREEKFNMNEPVFPTIAKETLRIDNIDARINILDQRFNDLTEEVSWLRQHYQNMLEEIVQLKIAVNKLNQGR